MTYDQIMTTAANKINLTTISTESIRTALLETLNDLDDKSSPAKKMMLYHFDHQVLVLAHGILRSKKMSYSEVRKFLENN